MKPKDKNKIWKNIHLTMTIEEEEETEIEDMVIEEVVALFTKRKVAKVNTLITLILPHRVHTKTEEIIEDKVKDSLTT
jgi:hypothetical protein